jgi:hypothetical protein
MIMSLAKIEIRLDVKPVHKKRPHFTLPIKKRSFLWFCYELTLASNHQMQILFLFHTLILHQL